MAVPMTDAQAIWTGVTAVAGIGGFIADYITSELCFGKGCKEANKFEAWLQGKLGHPLATFLQVVVLLVAVGLLGTYVGSFVGAIPGAVAAPLKIWQSVKNYRLYKSLK